MNRTDQSYKYKNVYDGGGGGQDAKDEDQEEELVGAMAPIQIHDNVNDVYDDETSPSTREFAKLLGEGKVTSPKKLDLLSTLILMGFDEEDCFFSVSANDTVDDCIDYMQHKCQNCCQFSSKNKMFRMVHCQHTLCQACIYDHFKMVIGSPTVDLSRAACPICRLPNSTDVVTFLKYLNDLGFLIDKVLPKKDYVTFCSERKKFTDRSLSSTSSNSNSANARSIESPINAISRDHAPKLLNVKQAALFVQLVRLNYNRTEAGLAAESCDTLEACLVFLKQDCEICLATVNAQNMFQMLNCAHSCCRNCAKEYFTLKITERNVTELVCIACNKPDIRNEDKEIVSEYFSNMDIVLKGLVDEETHELFQRKLRDWTLNEDLNFRWCGKCDFGFIMDPHTVGTCPKCNYESHSDYKQPLSPQHSGMFRQDLALRKSDVEQQTGLSNYLDKYGIECPMCHHKYVLVNGGCLHFTCSQCRHEFCYGCDRPFYHGASCKVRAECKSMGIHAHHPRNCSFYLRDVDYRVLEQLLKDNGITINTSAVIYQTTCAVLVQMEGEVNEQMCGGPTVLGQLCCQVHYVEYLCGLIKKYKVDSVSVLDENGLITLLQREGLRVPLKIQYELPQMYRQRLINVRFFAG